MTFVTFWNCLFLIFTNNLLGIRKSTASRMMYFIDTTKFLWYPENYNQAGAAQDENIFII